MFWAIVNSCATDVNDSMFRYAPHARQRLTRTGRRARRPRFQGEPANGVNRVRAAFQNPASSPCAEDIVASRTFARRLDTHRTGPRQRAAPENTAEWLLSATIVGLIPVALMVNAG
jgi:hypothetical protein